MKNVISSILTILCLVIIVFGFIIIIGSIVVAMGWLIILAVTLFASGGPAAAVFAQSWPVLLISFIAGIIGFLFISLGYLLLWIGSLIVSSSLFSGSSSSLTGFSLSGLFSSQGIFPGLDSNFDPGNIFMSLLNLLFLPDDQKLKLPPNILAMLECFRKCLCKYLCNGGSSIPGSGLNPGDVIVNTGKELLEDLKEQLEAAKKKLEELKNKFPSASLKELAYWTNKIKELIERIKALGGDA